jgi:malate synthase
MNVDVGIRYIAAWLSGTGAAAIHDLMEDAATAEISRAQIWQWIHHRVKASPDGIVVTQDLARGLLDRIVAELDEEGLDPELLTNAREVFESVALADDFPPFLTQPAYELLD